MHASDPVAAFFRKAEITAFFDRLGPVPVWPLWRTASRRRRAFSGTSHERRDPKEPGQGSDGSSFSSPIAGSICSICTDLSPNSELPN